MSKHSSTERQPADPHAPETSDKTLAASIVERWTRDYLARPYVLATLGALFLAYLACLFLLGPVPSTEAGNDAFLFLDGGWRILSGLVPHHDFYLSLGSITYMCVAAGLWMAHDNASGLAIGFLSFAALIAIFAFVAARKRMTSAGSILFSTFVLLLCTAPMPLGGNTSIDLGYAMIYNRFGYGLLSILFVTLLLRPVDLDERNGEHWPAGIAAGASLAILFFLKVSYFGVGAGLLFFSVLANLRNARRFLSIACGLAFTTLAMLAFLRFDVRALAGDLLDTVHARSATVAQFGISDIAGLGTTSLVALTLAVCLATNDSSARHRIWLFGAAIYTVASESLLVRTNAAQGVIRPLYVIFIFIMLAQFRKTPGKKKDVAPEFAAALIVMGLGLIAPYYYDHLRSLALLATYKTRPGLKARAYYVQGEQLRSLAFYDYDNEGLGKLENGRFYTGYLNDGIDLLKRHSTSSDIVASLSYNNPFSYALLRKPPHAGSTWFLLDNNISIHTMLSDARMFGDATVVMVPKYRLDTHTATDEFLFSTYKPYLLSHFTLVAESDQWRLYRRSTLP